jgi:predicted RNA-binding protein with PUA-like domain
MLEKDIENLIARYPKEFFPDSNFKLKGQQIKLGAYYADIVFEDEKGEYIIIEIKRGILPRETIGQIIDYYGILKEKEPDKNIALIIVANVIPKERTIFLEERLGIKFVEVSASQIKKVAIKYSYRFLDADKPESLKEYNKTTQKIDSEIFSGKSRVWIFQANPQRYDILNAMSDEELNEDVWLVNQHKNEIRVGDVGIIWMSGKDGGIYAIVDTISNPEYMLDSSASTKYWLSEADQNQKRIRVKYRYKIKLVNNPIFKEELKNIPELKNMTIFKQPQGTNFPVSNEEWGIISNLIKQRFEIKQD